VILDLLLIGLGIALEPFPLTAFILVLSAEKGTVKGLAYILGWLACLVAVVAAVVLATGNNPPGRIPRRRPRPWRSSWPWASC
jgi:threonine/homoserine/homoserine lactone efflux protein